MRGECDGEIGQSVFWSLGEVVALLRFENWKGEYLRIENEEVDEIDGWTSKDVTFHAKLVDLKSDPQIGYMPLNLASQLSDDDWASKRRIVSIRLKLQLKC
jgi:hypothetical protein